MKKIRGDSSPIYFPGSIVIDTREQDGFTFCGITADATHHGRPVKVLTTKHALPSGDYSLSGWESAVAIERKNMADLFQCCGKQRPRFERELDRLAQGYIFAAVVCEADWSAITLAPPSFTRLKPKIVFRSIIAWQLRYPTIAWWFCPGRHFAEITTFRLLERFWKTRTGHRSFNNDVEQNADRACSK